MRTTLRNRLTALERRARETHQTIPPFVITGVDADGNELGVCVLTTEHGEARCLYGQEAEAARDKLSEAGREF